MLSQQPAAFRSFQVISIGLVRPLPSSTSGYRYILSVLDVFRKFVLFFPLSSPDPIPSCNILNIVLVVYQSSAGFLLRNILCANYGHPVLLCDQPIFILVVLQALAYHVDHSPLLVRWFAVCSCVVSKTISFLNS